MKNAIGLVLFVLLPIMLIFLMQRTEIVRFVYERGVFGPEQTTLTATALLWYSFGMLGYGMQEMLNKAFYAEQNGKTPMRVSVVGIGVNVALSFLLVRGLRLGIAGLPMAASVAANFIAIVLAVLLNRKHPIFNRRFFINLGKLCICGGLMAVAIWFVRMPLSFADSLLGRFMTLAVPAFVGFCVYLISAFVLRTDEIMLAKQLIKKGRE